MLLATFYITDKDLPEVIRRFMEKKNIEKLLVHDETGDNYKEYCEYGAEVEAQGELYEEKEEGELWTNLKPLN